MLNKTILQGRFTKNPELKTTPNTNTDICNFTLAWNDKYKTKETTLFLNCVSYGQTAEFISKYFSQGDLVVVEGRLTSRNYQDNQGTNRIVIELVIEKAHFCGGSTKNTITSEDLPF